MLPSLTGKSSLELVRLAVEKHAAFKPVSATLERRQPSEEAAVWLAGAYETGDAPPWLTAHLLGQVGHEAGYDTVKNILLSGPGQLAESYAGPALARIDATRARTDLLEIIRTGSSRRIREGAAWGLARLGDDQATAAVLAALREGAILELAASGILDSLLSNAQLQTMLEDDESRVARTALEIVASRLAQRANEPLFSPGTILSARRALERVNTHPKTRQSLLEHFAKFGVG